jgi:small-conductance mechanosensitive channel
LFFWRPSPFSRSKDEAEAEGEANSANLLLPSALLFRLVVVIVLLAFLPAKEEEEKEEEENRALLAVILSAVVRVIVVVVMCITALPSFRGRYFVAILFFFPRDAFREKERKKQHSVSAH